MSVRASTDTRAQLAGAGALTIGSGGFSLDLWRRQGWKVGFAADPSHVALRKGIPALVGAAVLGGVATYLLSGGLSENRARSMRDASLAGYVALGGGVATAMRIKDPGHIWGSVRNAQGQLVPRYGFTEKFREVSGYAMNWGIAGALAGTGAGAAVPGPLGNGLRPLSTDEVTR